MLSQQQIEDIRRQYPILDRTFYGHRLIYLDNGATAQAPLPVVDAVRDMYLHTRANVHRGVFTLSQEATSMQEATRERVRAYINAAEAAEIIFTRGATESINLVASSLGELLDEGDEIVLTVMEHHANIVPWQMLARRRGIVIRVAPIRPDGSLDLDAWRSLFNSRTRLAAFCHVSNVLGTVNPVREMAQYAHSHDALVLIDGAQAAPHTAIDVRDIGADFYAFSSHKMYGPTGIGVLYGRRDLLEAMPPYQGGGGMIGHVSFKVPTTWGELPFKFEAGTPDYVGVAAFAKALDYIDSIGIGNICEYENHLTDMATALLSEIPDIHIYGTAPGKGPVISFLAGTAHHYDTGMLLDKMGVAVRTGHHCAQPLMEALGIEGTVRATFAVYNTEAEIAAFAAALRRILPMLL